MRRVRPAYFHLSVTIGAAFIGALSIVTTVGGCADSAVAPPAGDDEVGETEDDGEPASAVEWVPARGISIVEVEANQGTRVAITGEDGAWLGPDARNMRLVGDRDTLVRVHWTVEPGWQPHEVRARLTLHPPGGEPIVREQTRYVDHDSVRSSLERAFYFGLSAAEGETAPGTKLQVELLEAADDADSSLAEADATGTWAAPADGPALVGFEADPMQLKVLMVPIHYTGGGMDTVPDIDDEAVTQLVDALHERNPVQDVIWQVRGQIEYDKPMDNLGALLPLMAAVKQQDGAGPNVYYHAFIDIGCPVVGCGTMGVAGIAILAGETKNASLSRVGASVWWRTPSNGGLGQTIDTFVHEVGHNQGLGHVACPGVQAAGPDPDYPYPNGKIGQWGFGIRSFSLHSPTASHDYMSYCGNTWGSDWTYLKTYERIQALTSWDAAGESAQSSGDDDEWLLGEQTLVGALYPDGSEQWFTLPGGVEAEELVPGEVIVFERVAGDDEDATEQLEQPALIRTLSDGETQWVVAPLPDGTELDEITRVQHIHDGAVRRVIPREQIGLELVSGSELRAP